MFLTVVPKFFKFKESFQSVTSWKLPANSASFQYFQETSNPSCLPNCLCCGLIEASYLHPTRLTGILTYGDIETSDVTVNTA